MKRFRQARKIVGLSTFVCSCGAFYFSARAEDTTNILSLSLPELMAKSIMRVDEPVSKVPAAISIVTQDDIRRSGAMNIPEALRLVPGMDVAQVDSAQWAVSARGFNDVFANKLLVMQDGRSIYTPLFSGVFWDVEGTMMEDIDRIEVVRGPGATLWGANAVNGVINIVTKSAQETQGLLMTGGGGTQDRGFGGVRYGDKIGEDAAFRVYATYFDHAETVFPSGEESNTALDLWRSGFRTDWDVLGRDVNTITFQGDVYGGHLNQDYTVYPSSPPTVPVLAHNEAGLFGGNVLGRWTHTFSDENEFKLQLYYDRTERDALTFDERRDTFDIDFQHNFSPFERNKFVWGLGYHVTSDHEISTPTLSFNPLSRTVNLFSAFAQDEIALVKNEADETQLALTLGSKLERNDYTGFEVEPSARLLWSPVDSQTVWVSVSRAVRTPSRVEDDVILTQPTPFGPATVYGDRRFESENLLAYEAGYRTRPNERFSFDLASFFNVYDHLRTIEFGPSDTQPPSAGTAIAMHPENKLHGQTWGVELSSTAKLTDWWRLQPAYTFLEMRLEKASTSTDTTAIGDEHRSPQNQFSIRSSMDLPHDVELDVIGRYVSALTAISVPAYFTADVRLGWQINKHWEVAVVGQNLVESQHAEFRPSFIGTPDQEIPRSVYGKVTWRF